MSDLHERLLAEIERHAERRIRQDTVTCPCGETATATIHMDRSGYGPSEWIAFDHGSAEHRFDTDSMYWQAAMDAVSGQPMLPPPWAALKAIVEMHESRLTMVPGGSLPACRVCGTGPDCETVRTLARSMGVDA